MKICSGIEFTNEVNKYGHKISVESVISAYRDSWNIGMASHINHDRTKNNRMDLSRCYTF